ncbi:MAG: DUF6607 family protein [Pseudomonadota bacterium]
MNRTAAFLRPFAAGALLALGGCVTAAEIAETPATSTVATQEKFQQDREAILAMAGDFRVQFDFIETVAFVDDYELKDRKLSGGDEIVRVIEDSGDFISLQHILVVGGDDKFPVKHWRQDWRYEPASVLVFVGGNAWEKRAVSASEAKGKWSQVVYQVDDAPRYGALGAWTHDDGVSQWTPPREMRPLPRRDATTRDDYQAVDAVNRHAITPDGWVHEQDNSKLILKGEPQTLVREIAINTYDRFDDFDTDIGDDYWAKTSGFWAGVRAEWNRIEAENDAFGLTIQGEPEPLYNEILGLAVAVADGEMSTPEALGEAKDVIAQYVTTEIGGLQVRLAEAD